MILIKILLLLLIIIIMMLLLILLILLLLLVLIIIILDRGVAAAQILRGEAAVARLPLAVTMTDG